MLVDIVLFGLSLNIFKTCLRGFNTPIKKVLELDTGWCANEDVEPQKEGDTGWCVSEDAGLRRGVDCEIPHRLERATSVSEDVEPRRGWTLGGVVPRMLGPEGNGL